MFVKTHEEHVRRVYTTHGDKLRVVDTYTHSRTKVVYACPEHGRFTAFAHNVEDGTGCPACAVEARRVTQKEHEKRVRHAHDSTICVVGKYVGAHIKIAYKCARHGNFSARPVNIENGHGCMRCRNEATSRRTRKPHAVYVKEIAPLKVLERYQTATTPLRHKCNNGHVWITSPNQVLSGHGCTFCDKSQYRRRLITVGDRAVLVQGAEGEAVKQLLAEGVAPDDLIFTSREGRPTFRYRFAGREHRYVPDIYRKTSRIVIEVKSAVTLGLYDAKLFRRVCAKARAVASAGFPYRLMIIHRKRTIDIGVDWYRQSLTNVRETFRRRAHDQDLRRRRK